MPVAEPNLPMGQSLHTDAPAEAETLPRGHDTQVALSVALTAELLFPLGHAEQSGFPVVPPYLPLSQRTHAVMEAPPSVDK